MGIPTTIVTRAGFEGIVSNAFAGYGFPAEAPVTYIFPTEMFQVGSDLTPIEEHFDEFIKGLTDWEPQTKELGIIEPDMIEVESSSWHEAYKTVNNIFARNLWKDSLAIEPPTAETVDWILTGTDMSPDDVLAETVPPRGGILTVRAAAIALAMAGGRPEYLPIMIAAATAVAAPAAGMQNWNSTTNSVFPAFVVNGPMAKEIRLGSGYGCLGADPVHPAGQILGRAIRLIQQNLGGAIPGTGTMAIFGANRTCNVFFAEDDEGVPEGWTTLAEDRGFKRSQTVVTVTYVNSMVNVVWDFGSAEANENCLTQLAGVMASPNNGRLRGMSKPNPDNKDYSCGIAILPRAFAGALKDLNGYTKADIKNILWEKTKVDWDTFISWGGNTKAASIMPYEGGLVPMSAIPEQVTFVIGGGDQSGHGFWMQPCSFGDISSCEAVRPKNWDELLLDAEIDLGPAPASR